MTLILVRGTGWEGRITLSNFGPREEWDRSDSSFAGRFSRGVRRERTHFFGPVMGREWDRIDESRLDALCYRAPGTAFLIPTSLQHRPFGRCSWR